LKETKTPGEFSALAPVIAAVALQLKPEDVRSFTELMSEAMEQLTDKEETELVKALVALAKQLAWPDRLKLFVSALKFPTVYGSSRDVLIDAIKEYPEAKTIKSSGDVWEVIGWLKTQKDIDLKTPPQRAKAAIH
jgi:hypothetical protein